jgi:hypothetical protein
MAKRRWVAQGSIIVRMKDANGNWGFHTAQKPADRPEATHVQDGTSVRRVQAAQLQEDLRNEAAPSRHFAQ